MVLGVGKATFAETTNGVVVGTVDYSQLQRVYNYSQQAQLTYNYSKEIYSW